MGRRGGAIGRAAAGRERIGRSAAADATCRSRHRISSTSIIIVIASVVGIVLILLAQLYLGALMHRGVGGESVYPKIVVGGESSRRPALPHVVASSRHNNTSARAQYEPIIPATATTAGGPLLQPIFQCDDRPTFRQNKLVFVHVFKTAGSTIRNFFDAYSDWCFAGWAIIIGCATVDIDTIGSNGIGKNGNGAAAEYWNATHPIPGEPTCSMKRTWNRTGSRRFKMNVDNRYVARELDIIGGHLPLGVEDVWQNTEHLTNEVGGDVSVTHMTFVRNALDKLVSGTSYKTANPTVDGVVAKIRSDVENYLADARYQNKYAEYYITPRQKKEYAERDVILSAEESAVQQMANLLEYNVIVGATERMSDSLLLLRTLIDENGEAAELFEEFGMAPEQGRSKEHTEHKSRPRLKEGMVARAERTEAEPTGENELPLVINPSELSTRSIVRQLKKDAMLFLDALEFVRYEQQISDFALAMHIRQFKLRPETPQRN